MKDLTKKMLDVGRVWNAKITFQEPVNDPNDPVINLGQYRDVCSVFAEVRYNRSRLFSQAKAENTRNSLTFIIRQRLIPETWRIRFKEEIYQIESVMPLDRDRLYTQIEAYRYLNDQLPEADYGH